MTWRKLYQWMDLDRRCLLCAAPCRDGIICPGCDRDLPLNRNPCPVCAMPLPPGHRGLCAACLRHRPRFVRAHCSLLYAFPVDRLIHQAKYRRCFELLPVLGGLMARYPPPWLEELRGEKPLLVPVPLHPFRQLLRGYNQALELCRSVARDLELEIATGVVSRTRHTAPQQGLDAARRRRNQSATLFRANPVLAKGRSLLVVDDVMTTGATLEAVTRSLLRAGASGVHAWCLARAP